MGTDNKIISIRQNAGSEPVKNDKLAFGDIIRQYRTELSMSAQELASRVGVSKSAITNWESGIRRPDISTVPVLCSVLGISISRLFGIQDAFELDQEERSTISDYRNLNLNNRYVIRQTMAAMIEMQKQFYPLTYEEHRSIKRLFRNEDKTAAGYGNPLSDSVQGETIYLYLDDDVRRADEIITVTGDSMEPTYHDGDELLVEHVQELSPGEIGIFVVNGDGFVKEYQRDGLHSHNPAYKTMRFAPDDNVRCVGRVLSVVEKSQYASDADIAYHKAHRGGKHS